MKFLRAHLVWLSYGGMALAALLTRLWRLDAFITPDESFLLDHARQFLSGLASGDLSLTLGIGYPAVTVAWTNALSLLILFGLSRLGVVSIASPTLSMAEFLARADVQPLPYYIAGRIATVILTLALLGLFYLLARRLFKSPAGDVALLSLLLLSFDPFMLGYSSLMHHEIVLALLMLLAVMAWLLWLKEGRRRRWLLLASLFSGLALLTKSTALLVFPTLVGLSLLVWLIEHPGDWRLWSAHKIWWPKMLVGWGTVLVVAVLIFCALWPAMWQDPIQSVTLVADRLWVDKEAGQGNWGMFWMGQFVEDPGPAFYPVSLLLKLSPFMMIGLVFNLVSLRPSRERSTEWSLWAYTLFYLLVMTIAAKKSVRYLLPVFAAYAPLAGYGLLAFGQRASRYLSSRMPNRRFLQLGFGLLLVVFALIYTPYYLSYYNPLLLGWKWAPQAILVGWGEGLGDAARYLDDKPNAAQMTVAAWYDRPFAPFFKGRTLPISGENAMRADYTVFYINQVQRNIPDPNLITYFGRRQPEQVIRLGGIDYVWIYPAVSAGGPLPDGVTPVNVAMGGRVALEGYTVRPAATRQGLNVTLYWRVLQSGLPDYFVYVRAIDGTGEIRARADSPPVMGFWPTSRWEKGRLVADEQVLLRPAETVPGTYRLEVGMYDPQTWAVLEPATGERGAGGGLLLDEVMLP
jgi:4-amino-4-deoxy-L-arabinose transferase-like glycosyltransferase